MDINLSNTYVQLGLILIVVTVIAIIIYLKKKSNTPSNTPSSTTPSSTTPSSTTPSSTTPSSTTPSSTTPSNRSNITLAPTTVPSTTPPVSGIYINRGYEAFGNLYKIVVNNNTFVFTALRNGNVTSTVNGSFISSNLLVSNVIVGTFQYVNNNIIVTPTNYSSPIIGGSYSLQ
jgi:hypothetical protein